MGKNITGYFETIIFYSRFGTNDNQSPLSHIQTVNHALRIVINPLLLYKLKNPFCNILLPHIFSISIISIYLLYALVNDQKYRVQK